MRKFTALLIFLFTSLFMQAQTTTQSFYIDFGENNVSGRGSKTETADVRGNYWNNVTSPGSHNHLYPQSLALVNSANEATDLRIEIGTFFNTNGMSGGGGLTSPSTSLLGDLAVATATQDYIFLETYQDYNVIRFRGLDPQKAYRFHTFGSRATDSERTGYFEFRGENVWQGTLQMSGAGLGANNYNGNNRNILVSDPVFPDRDGQIVLTVSKKFKNGMVHINCMKVEELEGLSRPNSDLQLVQTMLIDFGETQNTTRGRQTTTKDEFGNRWNNLSTASSSTHVIAAGKTVALRNTAYEATGYSLKTLQEIKTNGINAGGLNNPSKEKLGNLAVQTATEDYIYTDNDDVKQIEFKNLDLNKCYKFYILGHRATSADDRRSSWYQLSGQFDWETVQVTSGTHVGGENVHGNNSNIAVSDYIYPDLTGTIVFRMKRNPDLSSAFAHANVMKIEEYQGGIRPQEPLRPTKVTLSGSGCENSAIHTLKELRPNAISTGIFETYLELQPGNIILSATLADGQVKTFGVTNGALIETADSTAIAERKVVRVRLDAFAEQCQITPLALYVKGNIVSGSKEMPYVGNGVWQGEVALDDMSNQDFNSKYFYFLFNNNEQLAVKRVKGSRTTMAMPAEGFSTENIRINQGTYTLKLDMLRYTWDVDAPINEFRISAFGSSVCNGQGASNNHGYAYQYGQLLQSRYNSKRTENLFKVVGTSIGGNTTKNLLDRYDEVIHDFGKYVIIGLSMGNEGIHGASNQQAVYDQFRTNMLNIINKLKADGKVPVVMNNYTRSDYNESDYTYIKKINTDIHTWAVPSVNTLGAIDDGAGHWAEGYIADAYHPNDAGHKEFFYAIPPSLFDALHEGKAAPRRSLTGTMQLRNGSTLSFKGENTVHPFTVTLRIKGTDVGNLLQFYSGAKRGTLSIEEGGFVKYISTTGAILQSEKALVTSTTASYNVTLTHYWAQKRTLVYVNKTLVGELSEQITPTLFIVGDSSKDLARIYSELSFWRSALTLEEITAHQNSKILKSSLDIYAPLKEEMLTIGEIPNIAQSKNTITIRPGSITDDIRNVQNGSVVQPAAYTLTGLPAEVSQKGIHIIDGRKVLNP